MTPDQLRWLWTVVGAAGTVFSIAAMAVMAWLLADARRYQEAINQVASHPRLSLMRILAMGEVADHTWLMLLVRIALLVTAASCVAGLAAMLGNSVLAISLLVLSEIGSTAVAAVVLQVGLIKLHRRSQLRRSVQIDKATVE